jgi:hypothetical protein
MSVSKLGVCVAFSEFFNYECRWSTLKFYERFKVKSDQIAAIEHSYIKKKSVERLLRSSMHHVSSMIDPVLEPPCRLVFFGGEI